MLFFTFIVPYFPYFSLFSPFIFFPPMIMTSDDILLPGGGGYFPVYGPLGGIEKCDANLRPLV
jgi:hypothetical protein